MATYTATVDPNGGSDYTSLANWEAGEQSLYSSTDIAIADCKRTGATKDTTAVTVSGWTAGVIPKIIVNAAYRHEGKWADTRTGGNYVYVLEVTNQWNYTLSVDNSNVNVSGLLITNTWSTTDDFSAVLGLLSGSNFLIDSCISRSGKTSGTIIRAIYSSGASGTIRNSMAIAPIGFTTATGTGTINIHNCKFIGLNDHAFYAWFGTNNFTNCYFRGGGGTDLSAGQNWSLTTCATADGATRTGVSDALKAIAYNTSNFTNVTVGAEDLHLPVGSALIGVTSTNLYSTFTTDIDGDTRPDSDQFGIGADYYATASTTPITWTIGDSASQQWELMA